jgi:WD40 repeat protein
MNIKTGIKNILRNGLLSFTLLLVAACGSHTAPSARVEVAASGIYEGTISADAQYAVIGSVRHGGSLWRLSDNERLYNWNHAQGGSSVVVATDFDPTTRWALTTEAHTVVLWDLSNGGAARFWTAPAEILDAKLAPDARFALLGQSDHTAVIFNTLEGGIVRSFSHQGRVRSVDLSHDGSLAITGSEDRTSVVWEVNSGNKVLTITHNEDVQHVSLSPDGSLALSAAKYDRADIWDVRTKTVRQTIPLSRERIKRGLEIVASKFSSDGQQILLAYSNELVELRDTNSARLIKSWRLTKRKSWQPTSVSALDVAFAKSASTYYAIGTSGFIYLLN